MGKFKVGDKVRLVKPEDWSYGTALGTVIETGGYYGYMVQFENGVLAVFEREIRLDSATPVAYGTGSTATPISNYTRKTKVQLVQIIENQKAEITKLVKEIEGLKNLKPAIAVQPVQAGQLVETVKRTRPKVGEFVNFTQHELKPGDVIYASMIGNAKVEEFGPDPLSKSGRYEAQISYDKDSRGYACLDDTWKVVNLVDAPKIPPLDPKKAWIKKGATGRIDPSWDGHYYEFMGDPVYDQEWGYWKVPTKIIRKNGKNSDIDFVSVEFGWEPYTPEKPKTFWDQVKVGDKIKVTYKSEIGDSNPRSYIGRMYSIDKDRTSGYFIVDKIEGSGFFRLGEVVMVWGSERNPEILKD